MEQKRKRMEELVVQLNKAARVYYQESNEIMTNQEYDQLYDELETLEKELQTYGYQLMLALNYGNKNVLKKNIQMFLSMRTNAFMYIPNSTMAETYPLIQKNGAYALQLFL